MNTKKMQHGNHGAESLKHDPRRKLLPHNIFFFHSSLAGHGTSFYELVEWSEQSNLMASDLALHQRVVNEIIVTTSTSAPLGLTSWTNHTPKSIYTFLYIDQPFHSNVFLYINRQFHSNVFLYVNQPFHSNLFLHINQLFHSNVFSLRVKMKLRTATNN